MVPFAGFSMPVQYESIVEEHRAVRERAGLFDVSHMGQIHLQGPDAVAAAERLLSRPVASQKVGRVRYGLLCNEDGGVVDDVTVYRTGDDALFLCVNAANIEKDYRWIVKHAPEGAGVRNRSDETGLLALQGPASTAILARLAGGGLDDLRRYAFAELEVAGAAALVSRTGYTGSDGFEIYLPAPETARVFQALLDAGEPDGLIPVGLGARDTLRIEAAMPLYGHELDDTISPLEAGLGRFVKLDRGGFIGAEAIARRQAEGAGRTLVGFELTGRGIARAGYAIAIEGQEVGVVTSGAPSPTLDRAIGLGFVPPEAASPGSPIDVMIRGRATPARISETPFVKANG
jgi:aminomethyltransferase